MNLHTRTHFIVAVVVAVVVVVVDDALVVCWPNAISFWYVFSYFVIDFVAICLMLIIKSTQSPIVHSLMALYF